MTTITLEPKESQALYEFVINERSKLPVSFDYADANISKEQLLEIYDYVASNRAKTRGTKLYLEVKDNGDVSTIASEAIILRPEPIVTPRRKNCTGCGKEFENVLPKCPNCGAENQR